MRLLIDTHVVLWAAVDDVRLRDRARAVVVDPANTLVVSVASLWEISIQASLGKLSLPVQPDVFFAREVAARGYQILDIGRAHAARVGSLPWPEDGHRDPFDRLLVAQALCEGLPMLSADRRLHAYCAVGLALLPA